MTFKLKPQILCGLIFVFLLGCGAHPGDHPEFGHKDNDKDPLKAAEVTVEVSPTGLKRGDRTLVTVRLQEIDENGVLLKIRFSHSLQYVSDSAVLSVEDDGVQVDPVEGPNLNQRKYYMLFYFSRDSFAHEDQGILTFQLKAVDDKDNAKVEIDVDLHDPTKDPAAEFDSARPLFGSESEAELEIDK